MSSLETTNAEPQVAQEIDWSRYNRLPLAPEAGVPLEASNLQADRISDYEERNSYPYLAEKLGFKETFAVDPQLEMKVRAVDSYIRDVISEEGLRDSKVGYETVLSRFLDRHPESIEAVVRNGDAKNLLERLFSDVAFEDKLSSKSYLDKFQKDFKQQRIEQAKRTLKEALAM